MDAEAADATEDADAPAGSVGRRRAAADAASAEVANRVAYPDPYPYPCSYP